MRRLPAGAAFAVVSITLHVMQAACSELQDSCSSKSSSHKKEEQQQHLNFVGNDHQPSELDIPAENENDSDKGSFWVYYERCPHVEIRLN
jgi:hypothetical protein